jgi:hypothetical protein
MFSKSPFLASISRLALVALVAVGLMAGLRSASADTLLLKGVVDSINGTQMNIGDMTVNVSSVGNSALQAGQHFEGEIQQVNGEWVVQQIIALDGIAISGEPSAITINTTSSSPADADSSSPRLDEAAIMVIEGPIEAINDNIITIYNTQIVVKVTQTNLTNWQLGNVIRVEGYWCDENCESTSQPQIVATTVVRIADGGNTSSS